MGGIAPTMVATDFLLEFAGDRQNAAVGEGRRKAFVNVFRANFVIDAALVQCRTRQAAIGAILGDVTEMLPFPLLVKLKVLVHKSLA